MNTVGTSEGARKGWTEESRAKRAEAMRRKWEDPEYRARRAAKEATPETRAKRSAAAKESNNRPGRAEHQAEVMKEKFANDSEFRERHSEGLKRLMQDPKQRASRSTSMKRAWADRREDFQGSLEALRQCWADPMWRSRRAEALRKAWDENPEKHVQGVANRPPNAWELLVQDALDALGVTYVVHKIMGRYELDIFVESHRLDIEVDGAYWHKRRAAHDEVRDAALAGQGIRVLRISDQDLWDGSFFTKLTEALVPD